MDSLWRGNERNYFRHGSMSQAKHILSNTIRHKMFFSCSRYSKSRIMFNTVSYEWTDCMNTCQNYNRAQATSFTNQAEIEELRTWALEVTQNPLTGTWYEAAMALRWMPYR